MGSNLPPTAPYMLSTLGDHEQAEAGVSADLKLSHPSVTYPPPYLQTPLKHLLLNALLLGSSKSPSLPSMHWKGREALSSGYQQVRRLSYLTRTEV